MCFIFIKKATAACTPSFHWNTAIYRLNHATTHLSNTKLWSRALFSGGNLSASGDPSNMCDCSMMHVLWRTTPACAHTASQQCVQMKLTAAMELLTLLKCSVGTSDGFSGVGGGAHGVQGPAVGPSLSAVRWVGDELEMSDGLPVRAGQLWVAGGLPEGWPDGSYSSLAPRQVLGFTRPCYTQTHYCNTKTHTPADIQTHMKTQTPGRRVHIQRAGNRYAGAHRGAGKLQLHL